MNHKKLDNDAGLVRVIRALAGLSLGVMAAFLASIRQVTPELKFEFSIMSVLAFVLALVFSAVFWRLVFIPETSMAINATHPRASRRRLIKFVILCAILCLTTLAAFGISLKGIGNDRIREVVQGAAIAVLAVAFLGFVLWRLGRFLEHDNDQVAGDRKPPAERH